MPQLRELEIRISLPKTATGLRAKQIHATLLRALLTFIEDPNWGAFSLPLHGDENESVGHATLR